MLVKEKLELVQSRFDNQNPLLKDSSLVGVFEKYVDLTLMTSTSTKLSAQLTQSIESE